MTLVAGRQCPGGVKAAHLDPGPDPADFHWSSAILPMNDPCVWSILVHPKDDQLWFVGGSNGLYITRDSGATWEHPLPWNVGAFLGSSWITLDPNDPNQIYAFASGPDKQTLYWSGDLGRTWQARAKFAQYAASLLVSKDGTIYAPSGATTQTSFNGVFISRDKGVTWQSVSFGSQYHGLLCWSIAQDPLDGTLYVGAEIYDHQPQPYHPPFFRSRDSGKTWQDISSNGLTWHVIGMQIDPHDGYLLAQPEGARFAGSADHGDHWQTLGYAGGFAVLMDPQYPSRIFSGSSFTQGHSGGLFMSTNRGMGVQEIGLLGVDVNGISLNASETRIYVASNGSGIYTSPIPASALPAATSTPTR
jgi:photosystem II stability/assembly factor-like uncharacterized protein